MCITLPGHSTVYMYAAQLQSIGGARPEGCKILVIAGDVQIGSWGSTTQTSFEKNENRTCKRGLLLLIQYSTSD